MTDEVDRSRFLARKSIKRSSPPHSPVSRGPSPQGEGLRGVSPSTVLLYHEHTVGDNRLVVQRLPLEGKLAAVPRLRKRPAATTDEVERRRFPHSNRDYISTFHLIPPLRGDLPLKGKAFRGASPSTLPSYHERTFLRYIPVVHRLPLKGKAVQILYRPVFHHTIDVEGAGPEGRLQPQRPQGLNGR